MDKLIGGQVEVEGTKLTTESVVPELEQVAKEWGVSDFLGNEVGPDEDKVSACIKGEIMKPVAFLTKVDFTINAAAELSGLNGKRVGWMGCGVRHGELGKGQSELVRPELV